MRIKDRLTKLHQRGDTIVEVLIAITVVSMILGGAYVTTNRSLLASRDAQERGTALKLVESQIEQLKGIVATSPDNIFTTAPSSYCISNTNQVSAANSANCAVNESGAPTATEPVYHLSISRVTNNGFNTFTITNTWTNVRGDTTNKVQMEYRLYK